MPQCRWIACLALLASTACSMRTTRGLRQRIAGKEFYGAHAIHLQEPLDQDEIKAVVQQVFDGKLQWVVFQFGNVGRKQVIYKRAEAEAPDIFTSFQAELRSCEEVVCFGVNMFKWDAVNDIGKVLPDLYKFLLVMYGNQYTVPQAKRARAMGFGSSGPWPDIRNALTATFPISSSVEVTDSQDLDAKRIVSSIPGYFTNGDFIPAAKALLAQIEAGGDVSVKATTLAPPTMSPAPGLTDELLLSKLSDLWEGGLQWYIIDAGKDLVLYQKAEGTSPSTFKAFVNALSTCEERVCIGVFRFEWTYDPEIYAKGTGTRGHAKKLLTVRYIDFERVPTFLRFKALGYNSVESPWTNFKKVKDQFDAAHEFVDQPFMAVDRIEGLLPTAVVPNLNPNYFTGGFWSPEAKGLLDVLEAEEGDAAYEEPEISTLVTTTEAATGEQGNSDGAFSGYLMFNPDTNGGTLTFTWSQTEPEKDGVLAMITPRDCLPAWEYRNNQQTFGKDCRTSQDSYFTGWTNFLRMAWSKAKSITLLSDEVKLVFLETGEGGEKPAAIHVATIGDPVLLDPMRAAAAVAPEVRHWDNMEEETIGWFHHKLANKPKDGKAIRFDDKGSVPDYCRRSRKEEPAKFQTENYRLKHELALPPPDVQEDSYVGYLIEDPLPDQGRLYFRWAKTEPKGALAQFFPKASVKEWEYDKPQELLMKQTQVGSRWYRGWKSFLKIAMSKGESMQALTNRADVVALDKNNHVHIMDSRSHFGFGSLQGVAVLPAGKGGFKGIHHFSPGIFVKKAQDLGGNAYVDDAKDLGAMVAGIAKSNNIAAGSLR